METQLFIDHATANQGQPPRTPFLCTLDWHIEHREWLLFDLESELEGLDDPELIKRTLNDIRAREEEINELCVMKNKESANR